MAPSGNGTGSAAGFGGGVWGVGGVGFDGTTMDNGLGAATHVGRQRYSFDFAMPVGTPVVAAREGTVVRVVDGYTQGYRRYAPAYSNRGWIGDDRRYGTPYGQDGRYVTPFEIGARDGFEKGREDARDDRYDPRRHKWYRDGDRDYNDRFGSRERYKDEYRPGFLTGYERGYRQWR